MLGDTAFSDKTLVRDILHRAITLRDTTRVGSVAEAFPVAADFMAGALATGKAKRMNRPRQRRWKRGGAGL